MDRVQLGEREHLTTSLETEQPPFTPWYQLGWNPEIGLQFQIGCCKKPDNFLAEANPKAFTAELWRHDVGELFIKHAKSSAYLEINLAPHAAWWACLFSDYREPVSTSSVPPFEPIDLQQFTLNEESWESVLIIPSDFLEKHLAFDLSSLLNVCFILGSPNQKHHFSRARLSDDPPDFHRVADFVPMKSTED